jgi:thioredoxin-disulfide reductase/thioredoxin
MFWSFFPKIFLVLTAALSLPQPKVASSAKEPVKEQLVVVPTVIIGGGIGGSTAAIYLARAGFQPLVLQGANPGGAITQSSSVENWPGAMKIQGLELMERVREQAIANGATYRSEEVLSVDFSARPFSITTRSLDDPNTVTTIRAESCIIATGSTPNYLGILGEKEYWGKGVSNCAICDGSLFRGKRVGVVGGGDSAVLEALYLSNIADEVFLFVRKDSFKASDIQRKEALFARPNVHISYGATVEEVKGNGESVTQLLVRQNKKDQVIPVDGLFLAIGSKPNTALFGNQLELDAQDYIALKNGQQTSVPGVYAIGDVVDPFYKQAISAAGDGAKAALSIQTELSSVAPKLIAAYQRASEQPNRIASTKTVIEITSQEQFESELKLGNGMPIVVDFYATWCSPCKRIAPRLDSSAQELAGTVKFLKVNVDQLTMLASKYQVKAMPTVLFFDEKGQVTERKVGEQQIRDLLTKLEKN